MGDIMAYCISYGDTKQRRTRNNKPGNKQRLLFRLTIVASFIITLIVICVQWNTIGDFFLPGDREATSNALHTMLDDIKAGASLKDAITTFCKEIVANAGVPG